MLDNNRHNRTEKEITPKFETPAERKLKRKKGRFFHCLKSGMKWNSDYEQFFLTLTSSPKSPSLLVKKGYVTQYEALKWYKRERWNNPLKFEYIKQHTSEGYGDLHVVFAGDCWPVTYLRDRWVRIHNAPQMVMLHIPKKDEDEQKRVISYQMKQYLYNQDAYIRFSCSRHWLFPGYRAVWLKLVKTYGFKNALEKWNGLLQLKRMPGQINFEGKQVMTRTDRNEAKRQRTLMKRN